MLTGLLAAQALASGPPTPRIVNVTPSGDGAVVRIELNTFFPGPIDLWRTGAARVDVLVDQAFDPADAVEEERHGCDTGSGGDSGGGGGDTGSGCYTTWDYDVVDACVSAGSWQYHLDAADGDTGWTVDMPDVGQACNDVPDDAATADGDASCGCQHQGSQSAMGTLVGLLALVRRFRGHTTGIPSTARGGA